MSERETEGLMPQAESWPKASDLNDAVMLSLRAKGTAIDYFSAQRRMAAFKALRGTDADRQAVAFIDEAISALATREEAPERRECDECGFKGTSDDASKEQDYCTACGGNSPAGGPDECANCGAKNHMVMACPKCGGRFSLDEDAREEAPAKAVDDLVDRFAVALKEKLHAAEAKYGHDEAWLRDDWRDDLIRQLGEHVQKGDPRDVAAYCAFAWHHAWSVGSFSPLTENDEAPAEAGDFGDALLAFLYRHGLKVALDVSEIEALRQSALRAQPPACEDAQPVGWLRAVDEEMVCAHLGVADAEDSFETAKKKLASLIQWNIAVATDPSVGGHPAPDALRVAVEALERIATVDMGGGFLGAQACRQVATQALTAIAALPVRPQACEEAQPVAQVVSCFASGMGEMKSVEWCGDVPPPGTSLYTHPAPDALWDAERYRYLRSRDPGPDGDLPPAGLFIGRVPDNVILTEGDADAAIDQALAALQAEQKGGA